MCAAVSDGGPQREPSMDGFAAPSGARGVRVCGAAGKREEGAGGHVRGREIARNREGRGKGWRRQRYHAVVNTHTRTPQ